jgi:hypothetical protein
MGLMSRGVSLCLLAAAHVSAQYGLQTRDAEMTLGRLLGDLTER